MRLEDVADRASVIACNLKIDITVAARIDLRFGVTMNVSDGFSQDFTHYRAAGYGPFDQYGKGDKVAPIDGGLFSIDALIQGN